MGRNAKYLDPITKSIRFPQKFVDQCPEDKDFTDWLREDVINLNFEGDKWNSHNTENSTIQDPRVKLFKKMVNEFVEQKIKMDLDENEIEIVKQTYMEMNQ